MVSRDFAPAGCSEVTTENRGVPGSSRRSSTTKGLQGCRRTSAVSVTASSVGRRKVGRLVVTVSAPDSHALLERGGDSWPLGRLRRARGPRLLPGRGCLVFQVAPIQHSLAER